jgi:single-stranded-DNA-specific exonuclease
MRYKLLENSKNNIHSPIKTVLNNRGIEDIDTYLNLDDSVLYHYNQLDNMDKAVECLLKHVENNSHIHIIPDADVDGQTSAGIMYRYLKLLSPDIQLTYSIHTGKQHGISDDIVIPENTKLLIVPDAATNDVEQCKELSEKGTEIIILDHHEISVENPYAIIVNPQNCDYPNKSISGVSVIHKFLQALDDMTWNNYSDDMIDMVALGLIGDCMDIKQYETRRLIDKGLQRIRSKVFKAIIDKQSYSMGNDITINNVQFYVVPLINALIRAGDYDEKELMFKAFIETDEVFLYKPRRKSKDDPEPEEIEEDIYTRVARLCGNAKQRQNKSKDKEFANVFDLIEEKGFNNNKIIFANVTDILDEKLTGLVTMNIADRYSKPCLLLRKVKDKPDYYAGSGRNIDNSPIPNLKDFLEETGYFTYIAGHQGAFGAEIHKNDIPKAIEYINDKLKDVDFTQCYSVDFIVDLSDLNMSFVKEMDDLKYIYGQGINEALVAIENLKISRSDIQLMGKNSDTWKYIWNDEITFIKFKCGENDKIIEWINDSWNSEDEITITVVGKCGINNYNGILTAQIIVEDYMIKE